MALHRQASCSLRLLLREQAEILARLSSQSLLESVQNPNSRQYAASCLSAQLQQGHRLLNDSSTWSRDANRGFHISLQGHQSAQAAAVQQQEEEDNEPEQALSANDPACFMRKADVQQSKTTEAGQSVLVMCWSRHELDRGLWLALTSPWGSFCLCLLHRVSPQGTVCLLSWIHSMSGND